MHLFGKKKTLKEEVNEMVATLKKQCYPLRRNIETQKQQQKTIAFEIKKAAKASDIASAKIYAKDYIASKKHESRLHTAITQIQCLCTELKSQAMLGNLTASMKESTTVMTAMSSLVKLPELQGTMQNLSKEMMKAGIIGEMVNDTLESAFDNAEDLDDLTNEEVERVICDITAGKLNKVVPPTTDALSVPSQPRKINVPTEANLENEISESDIDARLAALRS